MGSIFFESVYVLFQLVLINPLCLLGYAVASWRFFKERIQEEEIYLLNFFGEDYVCYQKTTGTGLPFIRGYRGELWNIKGKKTHICQQWR